MQYNPLIPEPDGEHKREICSFINKEPMQIMGIAYELTPMRVGYALLPVSAERIQIDPFTGLKIGGVVQTEKDGVTEFSTTIERRIDGESILDLAKRICMISPANVDVESCYSSGNVYINPFRIEIKAGIQKIEELIADGKAHGLTLRIPESEFDKCESKGSR